MNTTADGKEERTLVNSVVTQEAVTQVVEVGTTVEKAEQTAPTTAKADEKQLLGAFTVPITQPGRYRVEIVDTTHGGCPFSRTLTVNDKVLPILSLDNSTNSKCYNANQDLLDVNGGGSATLVAAPESQLPMSYSLKAARYADDNSAVTELATIPATAVDRKSVV